MAVAARLENKTRVLLFFLFFVYFFPVLSAIAAEKKIEKKIFVRQIHIVGSTLLTKREIAALVFPYEGKEINLVELKRIANLVTKEYQKRGYFFASAYVPPQNVVNGSVTIRVIEGRLGKITIKGNKFYTDVFIRYFLSPAFRKGMIRYRDFENALFLLNGFPGLHIESFLKPGEKPETIDIVIQAKDTLPLHGGIDYNNFGNEFTGQNRLGVEAWNGNLSGRGDLLDLRAVFPFPSRAAPFLQGTYTIPVSPFGTTVTAAYANADIKVGSSLQILDIRGTAQIYTISTSRPLLRTAERNANVSVSFNWKNVNNFVFGSFLTSRDRLRELALDYNDSRTQNNAKNFLDVSLTKGLGTLFGGMETADPLASREGANDAFIKLDIQGARLQKIFGDDFFLFRGSSQLAFSPLVITEQFALGGPDSVRGYPQSEFLGDTGWTLSGEFRLPLTASAARYPVQAAFFLDTGSVSLRNPLVGETSQRHLTGGGFGLRTSFGDLLSIRADLGFPIDPTAINGQTQSKVLYLQMSSQF